MKIMPVFYRFVGHKPHYLVVLALLFLAVNSFAQCPSSIQNLSASATPATCPSNGTATISSNVTGNAGATYQIVTGPSSGGYQTTAQSSATFTSLPPGDYTFRVTCGSATADVSVTIPNQYTPLSLNASVSNLCQNGAQGGTITASATGGNPGSGGLKYAFLLSDEANADDALFSYSSSNTFNATQFGTYQVRVKDACNNFVTRTVELAPLYPMGHLSFSQTGTTCTTNSFQANLSRADNGFPIDYKANPGYKYEIYSIAPGAACAVPSGATPLFSKTITQDSDLQFTVPATLQRVAIRTISPCGEEITECFDLPTRNLYVSNGVILPCSPSGITKLNLLLWADGNFTWPLTAVVTPQGGSPITHTVNDNGTLNSIFSNVPYASQYAYTVTDACGLTYSATIYTPVPSDGLQVYPSAGYLWCVNTVGTTKVDLYVRGYNAGIDGSTVQILDAGNNVVYTTNSIQDGFIQLPALAPGTYTLRMTPANAGCAPTQAQFTLNETDQPPLKFTLSASTTQLCGGTGSISASLDYNGYNAVRFELLDAGNNVISTNLTGTFINLPAGNYTVRGVADYTDCGIANLVATKPVTIQPAGTAPVVTKKLGVICENPDGSPTGAGKAIFQFSGFGPFKVEMKKTTEPESAYVVKGENVPSSYTADGLEAGTDYDVRITDQCGNTAVTQVSIGQLLPLKLSSNAEPCVGQPYLLSVEDVVDATYTWEKNGAVIGTSREINFPSYQASNDGAYVCTVVLAGGCVTRKVTVNLNSKNCGSPLPVTLAYFKATVENCGVTLNWLTSKEEKFDYFLIEKSADARQFGVAGKLPAAGTGNSYTFYQKDIPEGTYYYRLKMVDKDGTFDYSKTVGVTVSCDGFKARSLNVFPNPARSSAHVTATLHTPDYRGPATLTLYSLTGGKIGQKEVSISQDRTEVSVDDLVRGRKGYFLLKAENGTAVSLGAVKVLVAE
ncbi:Cna protein B-type domain-containing protein [Siphonobacter aquaeclarae]|uniref:Cna protein B-type domain-containing protein n=2 Tax=Siphonobacter aquaeclarae TaxID=563176 RepID=A0A1G9I8A7_9BACT|nr:Cna protein B-type domain-containing protein [Siphonobacter aquaeclarae]